MASPSAVPWLARRYYLPASPLQTFAHENQLGGFTGPFAPFDGDEFSRHFIVPSSDIA